MISQKWQFSCILYFYYKCDTTEWEINCLSAGEWSFTSQELDKDFACCSCISTLQSTAVIINVYYKQHSTSGGCYSNENTPF